jgi:hypothetical protein
MRPHVLVVAGRFFPAAACISCSVPLDSRPYSDHAVYKRHKYLAIGHRAVNVV